MRLSAEEFIAKWRLSGGNERANSQLFITDLCALLDVTPPQPAHSDVSLNDYVFERHVIKTEIDGARSNGWIDCYRRESFIFEAKQGSATDADAVERGQGDSRRDFFGQTAAERFKRGMAKRGTAQWTGAMQRAAAQAEGYAKALPAEHGWPPFLLVSDIGYCIDVFADFQRNGKGYAPFPDRRRYRITLDDLRNEEVCKRLASIWQTPMALDPSAEAVRVTREIAGHLAKLASDIEVRVSDPDRVAGYLMRLLFTMFAEDTGLIPKKSFSVMLAKLRDRPEYLPFHLTALWQAMDAGGFAGSLGTAGETVRQFNGYLFKDTASIELTTSEIDVLICAANADWRQVEPAIFGTLLERALNPGERAKLGAHFTPRTYVERLVGPTLLEPLRAEWEGARTAATLAADSGDGAKAREEVEKFHTKLSSIKVLDPACGTGNFLYVAMSRMKELEGEVLELLDALGDDRYLAELGSHTITPENFLGIEINPRAAEIAQLVLWIGYLQWHFRVNGDNRMPEPPVLRSVRTIESRDALISWNRREVERDEEGAAKTVWDGTSMRKNSSTGSLEPDEKRRRELYKYSGVAQATWPKADFVIGNPPFIGNKRLRRRLGDGYISALRTAYPSVPKSVDLVMYWWAIAADHLSKKAIRRFGLISTNSIKQVTNRAVLSRYLSSTQAMSLIFAIPDHPWRDEATTADVRIAMSVAVSGKRKGILEVVKAEIKTVDALPTVLSRIEKGTINSDLTVGTDVTRAVQLKANEDQSFMGVIPSGKGFRITSQDLARLGYIEPYPPVVRTYLGGSDLTDNVRPGHIIDFHGVPRAEAELRYAPLFSYALTAMKADREARSGVTNDSQQYAEDWWLFAKSRPEMRAALAGLDRYIATTETSKHRWFTFLPVSTLPDQKIRVIALNDAYHLGVLSSRIHVVWANATGGRQGVGNDPVYNNTTCFQTFPFPPAQTLAASRIRDAAQKLDDLRQAQLTRHQDLTFTKLYNALEALRDADNTGVPMSEKDRDIADRGCVGLIREYHDAIDQAVAEAYGWSNDIGDDQICERLLELNKSRATDEAGGKILWLRAAFQQPRQATRPDQVAMPLAPIAEVPTEVFDWPSNLPDQVVAVAAAVERLGRPVEARDVARVFTGKRAATVRPVLDALAGMGRVRKLEDGRYCA